MTADLAASGSKVVVLSFGPDTATYNIRPTDHDFEPIKQEFCHTLPVSHRVAAHALI